LKLLILHIVLFYTAICYPQQLSGFENIPWESSKETVRDSVTLINNIKLGYTKFLAGLISFLLSLKKQHPNI